MGKFFESELVREDLNEINQLQQEIYSSTMNFPNMTRENQLEHVDKLTVLLEKQKIMYARLSLSDDPDAIVMRESLNKTVTMMGYPEGTDISVLFQNMHATVDALKEFLET